MDTNKLKHILLAGLTLFGALYLGIAAATAQFEAVAWVVGVGGFIFLFALGKNVWCLIPVALAFTGQVNAIPGAPSPWWIATLAVASMFAIRFLTRKHDFQLRFTWLEFAIFLQVIVVAQAFVRNPAGLSVLGGDTVGGKPYISFALATLAFFLLSVVRSDLKTIKVVMCCAILASFMDGTLFFLSFLAPGVAAAVMPLYTGVSFQGAISGQAVGDSATHRIDGAQNIGQSLGTAALTLFRPITTINPLYFIRFAMMASSIMLVLYSGFRSVLGVLATYAIVSTVVRRKYPDILIGGGLAFLILCALIVSGSVQKLPFGAQRILSVLPIEVSDRARDDADNSSEWRFEMWRLALTTDRYIQNKILGDGFNFRSDELAAQIAAAYGDQRASLNFDSMEQFMAKGSYHGFHVEAIRMTGAIGLLAAVIALFIFLRYAWLQIQHFRGRPEWGFILFICIPFLIHPFYLLLVFGAYRSGFPDILVSAAMLKILDNIRVAELAEERAKVSQPKPEVDQALGRTLPHGRFPQPAMRSR
jgi:hypothetical protein